MPNRSPAESLLALFAAPDRAAAILGDLTEMAHTRGRLWFFVAYARTLFSLTRRILLALVVATIARQIIVNSFHIPLRHILAAWGTTNGPFLFSFMGQILAFITDTLWFVLPFAAARYGVRDRFVQFTFAVSVGATVAFLFIPFASLLCAIATLALAAIAAISPTWRKPLIVLFSAVATAFLAIPAVNATDALILSCHPAGSAGSVLTHYGPMLAFRSSLLAVAIVCSRLHRRLLGLPSSADRPLA